MIVLGLTFSAVIFIAIAFAANRITNKRTVEDVLAQYGGQAEAAWRERAQAAGIDYPFEKAALVVFKEEKILEAWASAGGKTARLASYPVLALSGDSGPKHGRDRRLPEGVYRVAGLNPDSSYHLSLRISYPNADDLRLAQAANAGHIEEDLFIHGGTQSPAGMAMGNEAIRELFVLAATVGQGNVELVICPYDFLDGQPQPNTFVPPARQKRYDELTGRLRELRQEDKNFHPAR